MVGAAGMAFVNRARDFSVLDSQFQMAPKWTHCRTQLSLAEEFVVSLGEFM